MIYSHQQWHVHQDPLPPPVPGQHACGGVRVVEGWEGELQLPGEEGVDAGLQAPGQCCQLREWEGGRDCIGLKHTEQFEKVGEGIAKAIDEGVCKREDLFITSKLWNTYHHPDHVEAACRKSLEDLGLDYLDLYLIHFPISLQFVPFHARYPPGWVADPDVSPSMEFSRVAVSDTWQAMERLVECGLVRNIGLSNWNSQGLTDIISYARIHPAVLQVLTHYLC